MKNKKTFWDRFAFAYDAAECFNFKVYRRMLQEITALIPPNAKVLECAAGTGAISVAAAPKASKVLCTDLSLPMLRQARRKARKKGITNIIFAERNLLSLPDRDGRYQVVIAANVIHLLPNPQDALCELWRVTGPGGLLIVPTFLTGHMKRGSSSLLNLYKLLGFLPAYNYTESQYRRMLAKSSLPKPDVKMIKGFIPVGFAVFSKPQS